MNKEDILKLAQSESGIDEREQSIMLQSFGVGGIFVCILCVVFSIIYALKGEHIYQYGAIILAFLLGSNFYSYRKSKTNIKLITTILYTISILLIIVATLLI